MTELRPISLITTLSFGLSIVIATATGAPAQVPNNVTYYCVTEFSGGLSYDERQKSWDSTTFRPDGKSAKFVLGIKFEKMSRRRDSILGIEKDFKEYFVTVTFSGTNFIQPCREAIGPEDTFSDYSSGSETVAIDNLGRFGCKDNGFHVYRFNLTANRFLQAYLHGYVDGKNNKDDTPNVSGGTCTKIQ